MLISKIYHSLQRFYLRRKFRGVGQNTNIGWPLRIQGGKDIIIGEKTNIGKLCWLAAMPLTNEDEQVILQIGNGCQIGDFNHFFSTSSIIIEDYVLTANSVYIADNQHEYTDVHTPVIKQAIRQLKKVVIGRGAWIGENVAVIGASIGRNCVIGANSVVTHDIPDHCIAVGAPARIIKRYNPNSCIWEKGSI